MEILAGIKFDNLAPNQEFKNIGGKEFGDGPNLTGKDRQVLNTVNRHYSEQS